MKTVTVVTLAIVALASQALAAPAHQDLNLSHNKHDKLTPTRTTSALQWIGPIAPGGEVYSYYGNIKDVGMEMVQVARKAQVHHIGGLSEREKVSRDSGDKIVCNREDQSIEDYGETWAAYKLAAVLGSLAATNRSAVVAIDGGHGHCVDLTACGGFERARVRLCNDDPNSISVRIQLIAEYAYKIIYECARQDGSGLIWGQQFDSKDFNVVVCACPVDSLSR